MEINDTIKWNEQITLIKSIQSHIGMEPLSSEEDRFLVGDMIGETTISYQEAADKYTGGNLKRIFAKAQEILNQYLKFLFDMEFHHNDAQEMMSNAGLLWEGSKKMLRVGLRSGAIKNAEFIFNMARDCHAYDIAAPVADALSYHYGILPDEDELSDAWYENYESCLDQGYWASEARHNYVKILRLVRRYGANEDVIPEIEPLLKRIRLYQDEAQSYIYWYNYYEAHIITEELRGNYQAQLEMAQSAYRYFDDLVMNLSNVKAGMLSYIIHAHNLLYQYEAAADCARLISNDKGANYEVFAIRLACTFVNTGQIAEALRLLDRINTHAGALAKAPLIRSYCLDELICEPTQDGKEWSADILICDLYCGCRSGKVDRYKHDYLINYVKENQLKDTREGLMIEILSLLRYRYNDAEKFAAVTQLTEKLSTVKSHSSESEVLRFETMIDELMSD